MATVPELLANAASLGEAVRLLREDRRMTLRQLAARIGVSAPFLSDLEHNRRSTAKLDELAEALAVPAAELRKFDGRLPQDLRQWMSENPEFIAFLDSYRLEGGSVEHLLRTFRSALPSKPHGS